MDKKKKVNCVITDLDNTIWDWFSMWYNSFYPYINRISKEFNIPIDELKADFKKLHQTYGSSEASFLYEKLETLDDSQKKKIKESINDNKSIIHEYNSLKKHSLVLYKGVKDALKELKSKDVLIIGFTESNDFFTKYRLKQLGLDGLIDVIYAPIAFDLPENFSTYYPANYWEPELTEFRYLPKEVKKPAPQILEIILKDFSIDKENTIYIGDKLEKDVRMANMADIYSIFAEYGNLVATSDYTLLREVTHWTDKEVETEKITEEMYKTEMNDVTPQLTLKQSFDEILNSFDFCPFVSSPDKRNIGVILPMWEKTINVQQHFNEIELKIRNLALTAFTFILGAVGYLEINYHAITTECCEIPYSSLVSFVGLFVIFAFFYMDKFWYHRLLKGAVDQAIMIEKRWRRYYPEIALTYKIGERSPIHLFKSTRFGCTLHSDNKYYIFYGLLWAVLALAGTILIIVHNNFEFTLSLWLTK